MVRHPSPDDLVLVALGEPLPTVDEHLASCDDCAHEVSALTGTVSTAREADLTLAINPPPHVWDRVVRELNLTTTTALPLAAASTTSAPSPAGRARHARPAPHRFRLLAAAAVVAVAGGAAGVGVFAGNGSGDRRTSTLTAIATDADGSGRTVLTESAEARTLEIDTDGLPAPSGFYEVWLMDPADGEVRALGELDPDGGAVLSVPLDVDLAAYDMVDVSAEPDDGVPAHSGDSVLRGDLPS